MRKIISTNRYILSFSYQTKSFVTKKGTLYNSKTQFWTERYIQTYEFLLEEKLESIKQQM